MIQCIKILLLVILLAGLNRISLANAPLRPINSNSPIEIISDRVLYRGQLGKAFFTGKVLMTQDDLSVNTHEVEVVFKHLDKNEKTSSEMQYIIFKNKITFKSASQSASADKGYYNVKEGILKMQGNVVLNQGGNIIKSDEMIYIKATDEALFKSISNDNVHSRVKAIIIPKKLNVK